VFGSVTAFSGKEWTSEEQFCSQFFAAPKFLTQLQHVIEPIACAADPSNAAVQIRLQSALRPLGRIILRYIRWEAAAGAKMDVHVDQPRQNRFACGIDRFGIERLRIWESSFIDGVDLSVTH